MKCYIHFVMSSSKTNETVVYTVDYFTIYADKVHISYVDLVKK